MNSIIKIVSLIGLSAISQIVYSGSIADTFATGDTLTATHLSNAKDAVNDNDARIAVLEAALANANNNIAQLQASLATVVNSNVMLLDAFLTVSTGPDAKATLNGINLQIVNGMGATDTINGLGNLIIGYDEANTDPSISPQYCSDVAFLNQTDCESAGNTWGISHKSGSHYLVLGAQNSYLQYGGMVAGTHSYGHGAYGTVTGGVQYRGTADVIVFSPSRRAWLER